MKVRRDKHRAGPSRLHKRRKAAVIRLLRAKDLTSVAAPQAPKRHKDVVPALLGREVIDAEDTLLLGRQRPWFVRRPAGPRLRGPRLLTLSASVRELRRARAEEERLVLDFLAEDAVSGAR